MKKVFLGIGSNLGLREDNLRDAVLLISRVIGPVAGSSAVYETEPWGFKSQDQFLNMVVEVETELSPEQVLEAIFRIETQLGRIRENIQYSSRVIDIDILLYGSLSVNSENLRIPHPRMHERRFVLVPLCDIAGSLIHPVLNKSMAFLLQECDDEGKVKKYIKKSDA